MTLYIVPVLAHLSRARTDFSLQFACFYEAPSLQHARIHVPPPIGRHRVSHIVWQNFLFFFLFVFLPVVTISLCYCHAAKWINPDWQSDCESSTFECAGVRPKEFTPREISNSNPIYLIQRDIVLPMIVNSLLLESIQ